LSALPAARVLSSEWVAADLPVRLRRWGPGCQHVRVDLAENKALVRRYYDEVLTGRDRDLLTQLLDPSFVSHVPGGSDVGADAYTAAVQATHAAFPALAVTVHDQVAEDDKVVTRWSASGIHAGDFAGVPATGRPVTVTGIHIHRVRRGRLVEHWEELNLLGVLRQLGVSSWPQPPVR
jgi:steroid delta-isomerase-like uncharacterized protein